MNGEEAFSMRSGTLNDEALEEEALDDDDGVTVDGILVDKNRFRVLLRGFGTSKESPELCRASVL